MVEQVLFWSAKLHEALISILLKYFFSMVEQTDPDVTAALPFFPLTKENIAQSSMIVGSKIGQDIQEKSWEEPHPLSELILMPEGFAIVSWSNYFKLHRRAEDDLAIWELLSTNSFHRPLLHLRRSCSSHPRWMQMRSETFHWRLSWIGWDCVQRC